MNIIDILFIGLGLSMDAFAVSVCKGLAMKKMNIKKALVCSLYFGVFQALMPLIGYFLGSGFKNGKLRRPLDSLCTSWNHRDKYDKRGKILRSGK